MIESGDALLLQAEPVNADRESLWLAGDANLPSSSTVLRLGTTGAAGGFSIAFRNLPLSYSKASLCRCGET